MPPESALIITVTALMVLGLEVLIGKAVPEYREAHPMPHLALISMASTCLVMVVILSPWPALNIINVPVLVAVFVYLSRRYASHD